MLIFDIFKKKIVCIRDIKLHLGFEIYTFSCSSSTIRVLVRLGKCWQLQKSRYVCSNNEVGLGRIAYPGNFKISGSGFISGGSIILLYLSGSGVLGYLGVRYPSKNYNIRRIFGSGFESLK